MPHMKTAATLAAALLAACLPACAQAPPEPSAAPVGPSAEVLELRNLGLAQLENEQPGEAEETFRRLTQKLPDDPLPWANLAIARLRQQKGDEALAAIDRALTLAPGRGDLLAIRGEVLQWVGREEEALDTLTQAARASFRDPETVFATYRLASTLTSPKAESWEAQSLEQLARLRPENVVVLSALGRQAIERGDREAATAAYLRLRELAWQGPEVVGKALGEVLSALEGKEPQAARVPAQRLENVLKVTPMYQQSLRELTLVDAPTDVGGADGERRDVHHADVGVTRRRRGLAGRWRTPSRNSNRPRRLRPSYTTDARKPASASWA